MEPDTVTISIDKCVKNYAIKKSAISKIAKNILRSLELSNLDLSIHFTDADGIKLLNSEYREKPQSTDVLSFPQIDFEHPVTLENCSALPYAKKLAIPVPLGDIVISLDDAAKNASSIGHSLAREVCFLLVHSTLHLVGHDHINEDDEAAMISEQKAIMKILSEGDLNFKWDNCVVAKSTERSLT